MSELRNINLFARLAGFYLILGGLLWVGYYFYPDLHRHLPLGTIEQLIEQQAEPGDFAPVQIHASNVSSEFGGMLWLAIAILGSAVVMIPVSWVYMEIRERHKLDQSLLETLILLPIVITGIVLIVHNSLALAFSLAGVMAGVRFRNTMKSTADSVFIFIAVGVGLASGIGMLMVAIVMTIIFNFVFLVLWSINYGGYEEAKQYMRKAHKEEEPVDKGVFE